MYEYLQGRNRAAAESVTASIRSTIARLWEMPLLGKPTDEADVHVIVEPEYLYRVFYRVKGKQVFVIRILHGRQWGMDKTLKSWTASMASKSASSMTTAARRGGLPTEGSKTRGRQRAHGPWHTTVATCEI